MRDARPLRQAMNEPRRLFTHTHTALYVRAELRACGTILCLVQRCMRTRACTHTAALSFSW